MLVSLATVVDGSVSVDTHGYYHFLSIVADEIKTSKSRFELSIEVCRTIEHPFGIFGIRAR